MKTNKARILLLLSAVAACGLAAAYISSGLTVTVHVDDSTTTVFTHRNTVGDVLNDLAFSPLEQDSVEPALDAPLVKGVAIRVRRARPITLEHDGRSDKLESQASTPADILQQAGVRLNPRDLLLVDGKPIAGASTLSSASGMLSVRGQATTFPTCPALPPTRLSPSRLRAAIAERPAPMTMSIRRALPFTIHQDSKETGAWSAAPTVGGALFAEGIYIYAADVVTPALDVPLSTGVTIDIRRAKPVTVTADGHTFSTRTQADTVLAMLKEEGVPPLGKDFTTPDYRSPISAGMTVFMIRVSEQVITESEPIPYQTVYRPDSNLELDQKAVAEQGKQGTRKRTVRTVFQNGKQVSRAVDREWVDENPKDQVVSYGTRVVMKALNSPQGAIQYWRAVRVWASCYTPASSGKARDHPAYGITRTGAPATRGVIAVDPSVIRLYTRMYVPGYGLGTALDTGGLVRGRTIDLAFDDGDPGMYQIGWTTIYLLPPIPADIPYQLPDYPRER